MTALDKSANGPHNATAKPSHSSGKVRSSGNNWCLKSMTLAASKVQVLSLIHI